jgi:hypothetical protein
LSGIANRSAEENAGCAAQGLKRIFADALVGTVHGFPVRRGTVVFLVGVAAAAGLIWHFFQGLAGLFAASGYERR